MIYSMMTIIEDIFQFDMLDANLSYLGILLISFIVSIIVFVPIPASPILIVAVFDKRLDPNLIAIYSASGIIVAKTIIFYLTYYGHTILGRNTKNKIIPLQKLARKYGWKAAIIAAMTPIPDDIVYVSLGLAKYSPWKFVVSALAGKLLINEIVVWGAVYFGKPFVDRFISGDIDPSFIIISVAVSLSILGCTIYAFLKLDMDRVIRKYFPKAFDNE
jgi:membrane protein DedA with SNARE-associated domain